MSDLVLKAPDSLQGGVELLVVLNHGHSQTATASEANRRLSLWQVRRGRIGYDPTCSNEKCPRSARPRACSIVRAQILPSASTSSCVFSSRSLVSTMPPDLNSM